RGGLARARRLPPRQGDAEPARLKRHRRHRKQHRRRQLEVAVEATRLPVVHQEETGAPRASHGTGAVSFTAARALSRIRSERCIATGLICPRPSRYGLSSALIAASVSTITVVADPISI